MSYVRTGMGGFLDMVSPSLRPTIRGVTTPPVISRPGTPTLAQIVGQAYGQKPVTMVQPMQIGPVGIATGTPKPSFGGPSGISPMVTPPALQPVVPAPALIPPPVAKPLFTGGGGGGVMMTGGKGVPLPDVNFDVPVESPSSSEFTGAASKPFPTKVVLIAAAAAVGIYLYTRRKGK